jgi:hypothetical protein
MYLFIGFNSSKARLSTQRQSSRFPHFSLDARGRVNGAHVLSHSLDQINIEFIHFPAQCLDQTLSHTSALVVF